MAQMRRLIVNADDFGFTPDVNQGIVEARRRGILRSTTLMANGDAFDDAVRLARESPDLDVGVHLVLVGGESVAQPGRPLPESVPNLLRGLWSAWTRSAVEAEFAAQIERIEAAGIRPTHLDTHKHTHMLPSVLEAVIAVSRRYEIPWIRRPFDLPLTTAKGSAPQARRILSSALRPLSRRLGRRLSESEARTTDHFAGFQMTGFYDASSLAALIESLPEGTTEFMCHPGVCGPQLRAAKTRLKESREQELRALTSAEALDAVRRAGVELCGFGDLL